MDDLDSESDGFTWPKVAKFLLVTSYSLLTLGIAANIFVFITVVRVMKILHKNLPDKHMLVYTLALSLVDSLVLLNLPFVICDLIYEKWIFGDFLCKVHYVGDNLNKTMSTMILTTSVKATVSILVGCLTCTLCLLSPLIYGTGLVTVDISNDQSMLKCSYVESNYNVELYFFYVIFALGYCTPLTLMLFFHGSILCKLCKNGKRLKQNASFRRRRHSTIRHVTRRMLAVSVFYFVCWTPYWFSNLYIQLSYKGASLLPPNDTDASFIQFQNGTQAKSDDYPNVKHTSPLQWVPVLCLIFYLLVYANSAVNPFLYGVFNLELRRQCSKAQEKRTRDADQLTLRRQLTIRTAAARRPCPGRDTQLIINSGENLTIVTTSSGDSKVKCEAKDKLPPIIESSL
uniref:G-protein coupled receptors family 1 profile domain-containing protein n=1 Tax=Romanomermis culicivorax TaxID=13658 RepID=A0A915KJL9_ROMCU